MHQTNSSPSMTSAAPRAKPTAEQGRPLKTPHSSKGKSSLASAGPADQEPSSAQEVQEEDLTAVQSLADDFDQQDTAEDDSDLQVVVTARQGQASATFRRLADEKLARISKFDPKAHRVDVELTREPNPRQAQFAARVELTVRTRGPVVRAEAAAADPIAALDAAWQKLQIRLRRAHNRLRHHGYRGKHGPTASAHLLEHLIDQVPVEQLSVPTQPSTPQSQSEAGFEAELDSQSFASGVHQDGDGPFVLREKTHRAAPMTVDEALYSMELVGHDFYLFVEEGTGQPCVLYARRGYTYGLLRLETQQ